MLRLYKEIINILKSFIAMQCLEYAPKELLFKLGYREYCPVAVKVKVY